MTTRRRDRGSSHNGEDTRGSQKTRPWHEILGVGKNASREEITAARNKLVREYHPDRLKSVEGLSADFDRLANEKLAEINAAYREALEALGRRA